MSRKRRQENDPNKLLSLLREGPVECKVIEKHRVECQNRGGRFRITIRELLKLVNADLVRRDGNRIDLTEAGRAHLARLKASSDPFLEQHEGIAPRDKIRNDPVDAILVDEAESPLGWLAKRRLISAAQFQAGERLRADFTRAGLTPRVTANWIAPIAQGKRADGASVSAFSDTVLAAKERVSLTLEAVGPEFAGVLLDVCCFLKGLETVERERNWPQRTAKVVLGLALDRLARHYGIRDELRGPARSPTRFWRAPDARPVMAGGEG